jgi:hemolysin activation/secretion protein
MRKATLIGASALFLLLEAGLARGDLKVEEVPAPPTTLEIQPSDGFSLPEVKLDDTLFVLEKQSVVLDRVRFVGNTVLSTEVLQIVAAPFLGKAVGADDIETLRQKVTLSYVERGFINSGAVLTANALEHGTLTLNIVEGKLKEIHLRGLDGLNERYVTDRLAREDEPLNMQTLGERFQLLLTDPLFARMNGQLLPDIERGKAILNVDIERARPYQLSLSANNYRPVSIGEQSATLSGWARNMTGYGDLFEASYQSPLGDGDSTHTALGWRIPLNTKGTQLSLNYEEGASSVIEQPIQPLDVQSKLACKDIGIRQTLIETLSHKFSIGLNRVVRKNSTTLLGEAFSFVPGEPSGTSKARDWRFWQEYSHHWENQGLALRSTFTKGDNNQTDVGTIADGMLNRQYRSWLGQVQYAHRLLDNGTQFILRLNIQDSPHRLIAMEGMSVGGINTVRGYRENQLVRDNGQVTNVELDFPLVADGANHLNLVPFFDYGRAWNNGEEKAIISSIGLAARLRWQRLDVDLAIAKRLSHPVTITSGGSNLQDQGIHLQVSYNFFGERL